MSEAQVSRVQRYVLVGVLSIVFAGCGRYAPDEANAEPENPESPAVEETEGVVEMEGGTIAAELVVSPNEIVPDEAVEVTVVNRGETGLTFGRPIVAERWTGTEWEETPESRETMWTMELLQIEADESGPTQRWPFHQGRRAEPGWYRLTKEVRAEERVDGEPVRLVIRARVKVLEP